MMELGALVCRSKSPTCLVCPVQESCLAYEDGVAESIPQPKKQEDCWYLKLLLPSRPFMAPTTTNLADTNFDLIKDLVCKKLEALHPNLTYHDIHHTLDVLKQCERIAKKEAI